MPFNRITKTNSLSLIMPTLFVPVNRVGLGAGTCKPAVRVSRGGGGSSAMNASIMQEVVIRIIVGQGVCICNTGWAEFWQPKVLTPRSRILEGFFTGKEVSLNLLYFLKWANPGLFFVYFRYFHITISIQIEKRIDGVLGIRTWCRRMVGADKTTELWRPPRIYYIFKTTKMSIMDW